MQVHLLLTSKVHEPIKARAMTAAAALLSPHALHLSSSLPLLPKAAQVKQHNAQTGWRLEASALGNAANGAESEGAYLAESVLTRARLGPKRLSHAAEGEVMTQTA